MDSMSSVARLKEFYNVARLKELKIYNKEFYYVRSLAYIAKIAVKIGFAFR